MCRKRLSRPELIDSAWVVIAPGQKCIINWSIHLNNLPFIQRSILWITFANIIQMLILLILLKVHYDPPHAPKQLPNGTEKLPTDRSRKIIIVLSSGLSFHPAHFCIIFWTFFSFRSLLYYLFNLVTCISKLRALSNVIPNSST